LPLTAAGEAKARALGERLVGLRFDIVYSSPLLRARRTAELAGFPSPTINAFLREVDYGDYEGLTTKTIRESNPGWELFRDGCPGGESPSEIYARARAFIDSVSGERVLAFGHGHILRAVGAAWIGADIWVAAGLMLDVATLSVLADEGGRLIKLWNAP
jgi:broad specificity phosphatase PhoE